MTNTPSLDPIELSPEAQAQYGTVVNNLSEEQQKWEVKIEEMCKPFNVMVQLTPSQTVRMNRIASDTGKNIEELVNETLIKLVENNIGAPIITGPSFAKAATKVTGYSGSVTRG